MKKFDVDDFCDSINKGMPYKEICTKFNIKTMEQFKRFLYEAIIKKGEIVKYDFPLKGSATEIKILNNGSIKIGRFFVEQALKKMNLDINHVKLEVNVDENERKLIVNVVKQ